MHYANIYNPVFQQSVQMYQNGFLAHGTDPLTAHQRALAVIQVEQNSPDGKGRARNDRILALPIDARRERELPSDALLPTRVREELEHFFIAVTVFEGKEPRILGWAGTDAAVELLRSSVVR